MKLEISSFNNTEVAFANKDNEELRKAYLIFKLISIGWLNKLIGGLLTAALKFKLPVKGIIKTTVFNLFCGGETIKQCDPRVFKLYEYKVRTILDYSVEGKEEDKEMDHCLRNLLETVNKSKSNALFPFCVVKLTALIPFELLKKRSSNEEFSKIESKNFDNGLKRIDILCKNSFEAGTPLLIDAEESWIQNAIDSIVLEMMRCYNKHQAIIFNTAQLYRYDRLTYIHELYEKADQEEFHIGLKIVRGAYMEKERARAKRYAYPSPIHPNKEATDRDFNLALKFCVDHYDRIALCCGTHNEESTLFLVDLMNARSIEAACPIIYFSQLLGMSDHISFNLAKAGYNVAKYVPYGPIQEVMPYLIRRAEENTSVAGQSNRELDLIRKELQRRKKKSSLNSIEPMHLLEHD